MSKYKVNNNYFEVIDTSDKAYWLGFLYADGCVLCQSKNNKIKAMVLEVSLSIQDKLHLDKFLNSVESDAPIKLKKVKLENKEYESCRVNICNTKICRDLVNLGCTPRKTYTLSFPSDDIVPKKFKRDFLRGFFDGDGCIHTSIQNGKPHIILNITGMSDMLNSVSDFLVSEGVLRKEVRVKKDNRSGHTYELFIHGEDDIKEVLDYMYKDSEIYLDRKYQKYIEYYKDYDDLKNKRGVHLDKKSGKYIVTIGINGKSNYLERYENLNDAIARRKEAEIEKMNLLKCPQE